MIYFIRPGARRFVKIGFATDIQHRLRELQCANPDTLRLVGAIEGSRVTEARIHLALLAHRVSGEWFHLNRHVRAAIETLLSSADVPAAIEGLFPPVSAEIDRAAISRSQAEFFDAVREHMGLSAYALARKTGLRPSTVKGWMNGSAMPAWAVGFLGEKAGIPDELLSILTRPFGKSVYTQERAQIIPLLQRSAASSRRAVRQ